MGGNFLFIWEIFVSLTLISETSKLGLIKEFDTKTMEIEVSFE